MYSARVSLMFVIGVNLFLIYSTDTIKNNCGNELSPCIDKKFLHNVLSLKGQIKAKSTGEDRNYRDDPVLQGEIKSCMVINKDASIDSWRIEACIFCSL